VVDTKVVRTAKQGGCIRGQRPGAGVNIVLRRSHPYSSPRWAPHTPVAAGLQVREYIPLPPILYLLNVLGVFAFYAIDLTLLLSPVWAVRPMGKHRDTGPFVKLRETSSQLRVQSLQPPLVTMTLPALDLQCLVRSAVCRLSRFPWRKVPRNALHLAVTVQRRERLDTQCLHIAASAACVRISISPSSSSQGRVVRFHLCDGPIFVVSIFPSGVGEIVLPGRRYSFCWIACVQEL